MKVCHPSMWGVSGCGGLLSLAFRQPSELTYAESGGWRQLALCCIGYGSQCMDPTQTSTSGGVPHLGCLEEEYQGTGGYGEQHRSLTSRQHAAWSTTHAGCLGDSRLLYLPEVVLEWKWSPECAA